VNQIFCIRELLEIKYKYNGLVHLIITDFKNPEIKTRNKNYIRFKSD
jgi:hypothetical protein